MCHGWAYDIWAPFLKLEEMDKVPELLPCFLREHPYSIFLLMVKGYSFGETKTKDPSCCLQQSICEFAWVIRPATKAAPQLSRNVSSYRPNLEQRPAGSFL